MRNIEMVDLVSQYRKIKDEVDAAVWEVMGTASFINGPAVKKFQADLEKYTGSGVHVVPCANGTDALQISMMALGLEPGDEVITPAFTYAATAEVMALLRLVPKFVEVDERTFNIDPSKIAAAVGPKTKAVVPVHLFGQCADMSAVLDVARAHNLAVIEDVAQAIGAVYRFADGREQKAGTMGDIAGTSFFPSKNLGCFGDGGAIYTVRKDLAEASRMIANHGQSSLYYHDVVGVNSRLDSMQAAVLGVKLNYLDGYAEARGRAAAFYDKAFAGMEQISIPYRAEYSTHVFHQYTLTVHGVDRDGLKDHLQAKGIPSKVYYPVPLHLQKAYNLAGYRAGDFPVAEKLSRSVLSLPMHTELDESQLSHIAETVIEFCKR